METRNGETQRGPVNEPHDHQNETALQLEKGISGWVDPGTAAEKCDARLRVKA
jgi:hypothetical protein